LDRLKFDSQARAEQLQGVQAQSVLDIGTELLIWQGRPAPRCFTFRRWRRILFWFSVFVVAGVWQWIGWTVYMDDGRALWSFIPFPLLMLAFCLSVGSVVRARLEWEHVFYVLSTEKLRIQCGIPRRIISFALDELSYARLDLYAENGKNSGLKREKFGNSGLGKLYLEFGSRRVALSCVEQAEGLYELLRRHVDVEPA